DFSTFFSPNKEKNIFSTKQAVTECLHILFPKFIHKVNIEVETIEDVNICSYITQYQQAILTILINALDMFEVRNIEYPKIKIMISSHNGKSKLSICDNAQGINKDCLDKIFEAYFSTKKSKKNSGLGLYISKMIVEQNLNGVLSVENTQEGAKFTIII
ncbi:MAG: HAMP domain-containing histidine kinase, partial [Campylobacteraceae bacterium]|nr:HAMP domain-containing histidine kinase [Campylobacteraceae bacterium]